MDVSNRFFGVMGSLLRRARWRNGVPRVNFLAVDAAFVAMRLTCMYDVEAMQKDQAEMRLPPQRRTMATR